MSDQGFFQRSINAQGAAAQSVTAAGDIDGTATVLNANTSAGAYTVALPDQVANAGRIVTVVNIDGANVLTVGVQSGDSLGGVVDGTSAGAAAPLDFQVFVCLGSSGWLQIV